MSVVAKTTSRKKSSKLYVGHIPDDILNNEQLQQAMLVLPTNYNFEIHKTIWRIRSADPPVKCVALQFPEGLLMYSCLISDIIARFANVDTVIMGDVTYGACCVDDFTAKALGCDFMVHYGHSCLVPINVSEIHMLYVFVDIAIDTKHLVETLKHNFSKNDRLVLAGTIQFASALHEVSQTLKEHFAQITIPQAKPLSKGEVLGCTSPVFADTTDSVVFVADGRFHLESMMIQNPQVSAFYKYNPYDRSITRERYDHQAMHEIRQAAIEHAKGARRWGVIMGSLGRQGNPNIVNRLIATLQSKGLSFMVVLLSEIFPAKLEQMHDIEAWVQVACPRLSIDWGYAFQTPLLNAYEANVALSQIEWQPVYPMDFYRKGGGEWTNYYEDEETKKRKEKEKAEKRARFKARAKQRRKVKIEYDNE